MMEDFVISEGRAYHPGDVVLLRLKVNVPRDTFRYLREQLQELSAKTGVEFVLMSQDVEVHEPIKEPA